MSSSDDARVVAILSDVKRFAQEYRALTGRPLGVTGEIAEYEVRRVLGYSLMPARYAGYDAEGPDGCRYQIKGRCVLAKNKSQRVPSINKNKAFDAVLLVLLDENLDAYKIYRADRQAVIERLERPGSKARNERNSMNVSQFKSIADEIWSRDVTPSATLRPARKVKTPVAAAST